MKKILLISLFVVISCQTDKKTSTRKEIKTEIESEKPKEEIKYVTAKSGLIYRDKPKGEYLGKFEFNSKISVIKHTNVLQEIKNENETIKGEWVGVKLDKNRIVYVFNGFLSNIKQEYPKISFEEAEQYLYNGIWVSKEFQSILQKTKLYSNAGYYRDSPHNIIFYGRNKASCWSENEMEELYFELNKDLTISGINAIILNINKSTLTIQINGKNFSYFKINRLYTSEDAVFEVVRLGTKQVIEEWFSGKYIFSIENKKIEINYKPNDLKDNFIFAWYEDYDNNIIVNVIEIYGNLYKINKIEDETYFLEQIEPIEDVTEPKAISTEKKASLTKISD